MGHTLVYRVCSESTAPRDAEFQCFDMYLDYCRGAVEAFEGKQRQDALKALQAVFKYLDQHYTATKVRPGAKTTKQATSKLAHGQSLKFCAQEIEKDINWLPLFYTTSTAPDGSSMTEPADSRNRDAVRAETGTAPAAKSAPPPARSAPAAAKTPSPERTRPQVVSPAERYHGGSQTDRGKYKSEVEGRVRQAQAELEEDPLGFQQYLMSRASAYDPRVGSAVFAANSMRRAKVGVSQQQADRALMSLASSYTSSRLDPYLHPTGPLSDPRGASWSGPGRLSSAEASARAHAHHAAAYGHRAPHYGRPYGGY